MECMETDACRTCGQEGRLVGEGMAAYWSHVNDRTGRTYPSDHDFVPLSQTESDSE